MIKQSFDMLSPYADHLNELLSFTPQTDIITLAPPRVPERRNLFDFINPVRIPKLDFASLSKKIEVWSEYLLDQWISASKGLKMIQLEKLKIVAIKIFEEKKIEHIKTALRNLDIRNERIDAALEKLQKRVLTILNPVNTVSPHIAIPSEKHQVAIAFSSSPTESDLRKYIQNRSFSDSDMSKTVVDMHHDRRITRHINARILDIQVNKEQKQRLLIRMREIFERISPSDLIELAKAFSALKSADEWRAFGKIIKPVQVLNLLEICLNDIELNGCIPRILINLSFSTLEDMLLGASPEQLYMINKLFSKSEDVHQEWFMEIFKKKRQNFANVSNSLASRIDDLDKRFRQIEPTFITHHDIKQMDELVDDIYRHWNSFRNFASIIKGAVNDHVTLRLLIGTAGKPCELEEEYSCHFNRMSRDSAKYNLARGCPYEIIHGIIFHDRDLEDSDDAAEIFGAWGILSIDDYEDVGLVNDFPEWVKRDWETNPSKAHRLARFYAVKKLAILAGDPKMQTIQLWKHLRIYNKWMLKKYLNNPHVRNQLSYFELSKLSGDPQVLPSHSQRLEGID